MGLIFKEDTHEYFLDGKKLISVTQLMQKHGLAPNYAGVPAEVLKKKAERGTLIHKEIEDYVKNGDVGFTKELQLFINDLKERKTEVLACELRVYNDICAGTLDLLLYELGKYIITDNKTTLVLHKEQVRWQLSIYRNLLNYLNLSINTDKGRANHFPNEDTFNVVDMELIPFEEVERLFECERQGKLYKQELAVNDNQLQQLAELEAVIKKCEDEKKQAELQAQELRAALMEAMEKNGVKTFENDHIKLTYIEPSTRVSIDSAKLKKDLPQIAEKYTKTSNVKASLRITLKEK